MSEWFDRKGKPIPDLLAWGKMYEDREYKIVKQDHIGQYFISTVWLGLNHSWVPGKKLIFESMVFDENKKREIKFDGVILVKKEDMLGEEVDMARYATEAQAVAGHKKLVDKYKKLIKNNGTK